MVTTCTLASSSSPTRRHSGKNHSSLGSLISTRSWPENCSSNHSRTSMLTCSSRQSLAVSAQAVGLASEACTLAWRKSFTCLSTTHCDSPNPRGLLSSAFTHGLGTWKPRLPTTLANRLVPLRPEPATSSKWLLTLCSLPVVRRLRSRSSILTGEYCRFAATLAQWRLPVLYSDETAENRFGASMTAHERHVGAAEVFDDVHSFCTLHPHHALREKTPLPESVEQLPFPPLAPVNLDLEVRVRPVPKLVCVEPFQLKARKVRQPRHRITRSGQHQFPVEGLGESVVRRVPPTPRLRLPRYGINVGDALALYVDGISPHRDRRVDTLQLPGQIPHDSLPLGRQHHVPIPLQRIARAYLRKRPVVEVGQAVHRIRIGPQMLRPTARDHKWVGDNLKPLCIPRLLGNLSGHLWGAIGGAVVDHYGLLHGAQHPRQDPGQRAGLVFDPQDRGETRP